MDRELEQQIEELIQKTINDLKTKIIRIVIKNQNKVLKDQARELKTGGSTTAPQHRKERVGSVSSTTKGSLSTTKGKTVKKDGKYQSDSDTDGYYSS
jgi:hypothetical protein